jgi:hypothetical protein
MHRPEPVKKRQAYCASVICRVRPLDSPVTGDRILGAGSINRRSGSAYRPTGQDHRYHSDIGLVAAASRTGAGYRRYGRTNGSWLRSTPRCSWTTRRTFTEKRLGSRSFRFRSPGRVWRPTRSQRRSTHRSKVDRNDRCGTLVGRRCQPRQCLSVHSGQERKVPTPPTSIYWRTGHLRQDPDRGAQFPGETGTCGNEGVAYGRTCGGDRRRRSDGDDAGG